jgi:hypothetical protein
MWRYELEEELKRQQQIATIVDDEDYVYAAHYDEYGIL